MTTTTIVEGRAAARAALTMALADDGALSPLWGLEAWPMALAAVELLAIARAAVRDLTELDADWWPRLAVTLAWTERG